MRKITKRYIFLEITEAEYDFLRKNITNFLLRDGKTQGFVLSHASKESIEGSHVNQEKKQEEVSLPNGERIKFERPVVDIVSFKISRSQASLIELTNPPRKTSVFLRDLELSSEFSIAFKSMNVNLHNFHEEFIQAFPEAQSYLVFVKSASISEQTFASLKIESEKSAYIEGDNYFKLSNKVIDKIGFKIKKERLEITRHGTLSGSINFVSENEDKIKSIIINNCQRHQ